MPAIQYYYEPETDWRDRLRSIGQNLAIRAMNRLAECRLPNCLYWWIQDELSSLFAAWWEKSPEQLWSTANGEIPLHAIGEWERSHIPDFDFLDWYCSDCYHVTATWATRIDEHCPHCETGLLNLADESMIEYCRRSRAGIEREARARAVLLLSERRAA